VKFAHSYWLFGTGLALVVAAFLIAGGLILLKSIRRFGDEAVVTGLITGRAGGRRALKGVLLVLAVALGFAALAGPQYGRGTRLIPATNLDVVIVLDYSKSMYARDVVPTRTVRAKAEVARLIAELPGARFGAVAFAGQPMSFPVTIDGGAIAQFFRQLTPNDMPIGGTAIARALEAARELLKRDPLSAKHRKVILLVTDGEDLEGDPVAVAQGAAHDDVAIHVVQIGGRTPEPLPEVNEAGEITGNRVDDQGRPVTTSLSADGEAQLAKIAEVSKGRVVRSQQGDTGISEIAAGLKQLMTEELSEKVETVFADVYMYPLGLALVLLVIETFVNETKKRARAAIVPPPPRRRRIRARAGAKRAAAAAALSFLVALGCDRLTDPFMRHAPPVDQAIVALDAGDASAAVDLLSQYLTTGKCEGGNIGTPDNVHQKHNASFDLGLGLFRIAEQFGRRFGEEESFGDAGPTPEEEARLAQRRDQIDCALRIVRLAAADPAVPIDLRARANYLAGNLEFLRREYASAVKAYDLALQLIPGLPGDAGDGIGRDAAYNRALALLREQEQKDKKKDAAPPDAPPPDAGADSERGDSGNGDKNDKNDKNDKQDSGKNQDQPDSGKNDDQDKSGPDGGPPERDKPPPEPERQSPSVNQDERILDMLERAPTLQQHDARNRALQGRGTTMEDK